MMDNAVLEEPRLSCGSVTVPKRLLGCWDRRYIRFSDGTEDTSTRVLWVQTLSGVGDIRIPATRPNLSARTGLCRLLQGRAAGIGGAGLLLRDHAV